MAKKTEELHKIDQNLQVRQTKAFKLKDKIGRQGVRLNLEKVFGFIPEEIVIAKVVGQTNCFVVNALLTPAEIEKERIIAEKVNNVEVLKKTKKPTKDQLN